MPFTPAHSHLQDFQITCLHVLQGLNQEYQLVNKV